MVFYFLRNQHEDNISIVKYYQFIKLYYRLIVFTNERITLYLYTCPQYCLNIYFRTSLISDHSFRHKGALNIQKKSLFITVYKND